MYEKPKSGQLVFRLIPGQKNITRYDLCKGVWHLFNNVQTERVLKSAILNNTATPVIGREGP
jgi:hypothetical protein